MKLVYQVLKYDWVPVGHSPLAMKVAQLSDAELEERLSGLSEQSKEAAGRLLHFCRIEANLSHSPLLRRLSLIRAENLFTREQRAKFWWEMDREKYFRRKFHLDHAGAAESLVYHHGLKSLPKAVHDYIRDKDFIDAGAFHGDSALILRYYQPRCIYSFDPSRENCLCYAKTMKKNQVSPATYQLVPMGLSDHSGKVFFLEQSSSTRIDENSSQTDSEVPTFLTTIDEFAGKNQLKVGLIKADIEGMELLMLQGALETIRNQRPVLLISVYHDAEQLTGVYEFLKQLNLNYHFEIINLAKTFFETTLIGYPVELTDKTT